MRRSLVIVMALVLCLTMEAIGVPKQETEWIYLSHFFSDWHVIESEPISNYPVLSVARVIEGDSFEFWLHVAPRLAYFADIRLADIDTPEVEGDCTEEGLRVKDIVKEFLQNAGAINIRRKEVDKYGRWICTVSVDGQDLAEWIKKRELTKEDLCPESVSETSRQQIAILEHPVGEIGETKDNGYVKITLLGVRTATSIDVPESVVCIRGPLKPDPGCIYVVINLRAEALRDDTSLTVDDFRVVDNNHRVQKSDPEATECLDHSLTSLDLDSGQWGDGSIAFQVYPASGPYILEFEREWVKEAGPIEFQFAF